jgi:hypothetical protein
MESPSSSNPPNTSSEAVTADQQAAFRKDLLDKYKELEDNLQKRWRELSGKVDHLTQRNAQLEMDKQTDRKEVSQLKQANLNLENKLTSLQSGSPSGSSVTTTPVQIKGTNGGLFEESAESKSNGDHLMMSKMKKSFTDLDGLEVLKKFYDIAALLDRVSVQTAWRNLPIFLQTLKSDLSATLMIAYQGATPDLTADKNIDWRTLMSKMMKLYAPLESSSTLTKRMKSVAFRDCTGFRAQFNKKRELFIMLDKSLPSPKELTKIVLKAIKRFDKRGSKAMLNLLNLKKTDANCSQEYANASLLEDLPWTSVLELYSVEEAQKAQLLSMTSSSSSESSSDEEKTSSRKRPRRTRSKKNSKSKKQKTQNNGSQSAGNGSGGNPKTQKQDKKKKCYRCEYGNHPPNDCRHKESICNACNRKGHIARACKIKPSNGDSKKSTNHDQQANKSSKKVGWKKKASNKKQEKKKTSKTLNDSDSSDESEGETSNLVHAGLTPQAALTLFNELSKTLEHYDTAVIARKGNKPTLPAMLNDLKKYGVVLDTGTNIDIIDEEVVKALKALTLAMKGQVRDQYHPCAINVKSAGGTKLQVMGKTFMCLDLGKGVRFATVFVIVKNLGVPALIGMQTLSRVGVDICMRSPRRIVCDVPGQQDPVEFPLTLTEAEAEELAESYLTIHFEEVEEAIRRTEAPNTSLEKEIFASRGEEKDQSF